MGPTEETNRVADVTALLRRTLQQLRADRTRIDRQITALEGALTTLGGRAGWRAPGAAKKASKTAARPRRTMSATQKKAISQRMKAYWATRRTTAAT